MTEQSIQIAVARADMFISWVLALPWKRIGLSLLIAVIVVHIIKRAVIEMGDKHAVGNDFDRRPDILGDGDDVRGGTNER
jgi:hypothetical protein